MPVTSNPEPKRRFLPSKWEWNKVRLIVRGIHSGRIKPLSKLKEEREEKRRRRNDFLQRESSKNLFLMWDDEEDAKNVNNKQMRCGISLFIQWNIETVITLSLR